MKMGQTEKVASMELLDGKLALGTGSGCEIAHLMAATGAGVLVNDVTTDFFAWLSI